MKKTLLSLMLILALNASAGEKKIEVCFTDPEKIRKSVCEPEAALISLINSCSSSFDGAFYDISSMRVTAALLEALDRGVTIRLVTESDTLSGRAIEQIIDAGIPVVHDGNHGLMHNKFAIVDRSIVYTGSTNATDNCAYKNNNNSVIIKSVELAEIYSSEFEEMFIHGVFGNRKEYGIFAPFINRYHVKVDGININAYFSPDNNVEKIINSRIRKAEKSIRFMAFSFTSDLIGETMIEKFKKGITVEGIFERNGSGSEHSEYTKMLVEGIPVKKDGNWHQMHHKVIIIDEKIVITGSFNFSKNANIRNDENIIIIDSQVIAAEYIEEFRRIYNGGAR